MRYIQMHHTVTNHDAIGNDIEIMSKILNEENECYVFAINQVNEKVKYIDEAALEEALKDEDTVLIYHHSVYWEEGYEKIKNAKCKVVFRYHNITPPEFFKDEDEINYEKCVNGLEQTKKLIKEFPDAFWLCASIFNSIDLAGVPKDNIGVCPPFNKIEEWSKKKPDDSILSELNNNGCINILFVGRVVPNKGHLMMLEILRYYKAYYDDNIHLNIIGKFDDNLIKYNALVRQKIEEYDLSDNIEFVGEVTDETLLAYYKGSDLLLVCSEHEGFCVPVAEAQFFSLPIVVLNKSALPETAGEEQLVLDDDIYKYIAAIRLINENKQIKDFLIQKGRDNYNNRFSYEKIKERFLGELEKVR